jgi:hypothetical protein
VDPEPASQNIADPDPQAWLLAYSQLDKGEKEVYSESKINQPPIKSQVKILFQVDSSPFVSSPTPRIKFKKGPNKFMKIGQMGRSGMIIQDPDWPNLNTRGTSHVPGT